MGRKNNAIKLFIIFVLIIGAMIFAFYYSKAPIPTLEVLSPEWSIWTATGYTLIWKTQNAKEVIINGRSYGTWGSLNYSLGWTLGDSMKLSITVKNEGQSYDKEVIITRYKTPEEIAVETKEQEKAIKEQERIAKEKEASYTFEDRVSNIVGAYWTFEVTIATLKGDFATSSSKPPFVIIINTTSSDVSSCFDAKDKLFSIMKALYTNSDTKGKIARVRFSAWGYLQASLGSSDLWFSRSDSGPSNLFKVLLQYKSYEDESGPMNTRTRGKDIGGCE
jgi:hypothetical protein